MSEYTLTLPADVYSRARHIADQTDQPIERVLIDHLKSLREPLLPPDEQEELNALRHLSDDALWTIAQQQMPIDAQARGQILMDKNSLGTITDAEYTELKDYVERGNRLMTRKAEAAGILIKREHNFTQEKFTQNKS